MILLGQKHDAIIEQVRIRVVSVDEEDFGNVSASRPAFDVDDDIEGISDVGLNCTSAFFQERCVATDSTVNFEPLPFA